MSKKINLSSLKPVINLDVNKVYSKNEIFNIFLDAYIVELKKITDKKTYDKIVHIHNNLTIKKCYFERNELKFDYDFVTNSKISEVDVDIYLSHIYGSGLLTVFFELAGEKKEKRKLKITPNYFPKIIDNNTKISTSGFYDLSSGAKKVMILLIDLMQTNQRDFSKLIIDNKLDINYQPFLYAMGYNSRGIENYNLLTNSIKELSNKKLIIHYTENGELKKIHSNFINAYQYNENSNTIDWITFDFDFVIKPLSTSLKQFTKLPKHIDKYALLKGNCTEFIFSCKCFIITSYNSGKNFITSFDILAKRFNVKFRDKNEKYRRKKQFEKMLTDLQDKNIITNLSINKKVNFIFVTDKNEIQH